MGNKGLSESTVDKHESYGMVGINRTQSSGTHLFGSIATHHSFITLTIKHAERVRHLAQDWYHADSLPIIEIEMSHSQFAEMITSPGIGEGVPCTIRGLDGELLEHCPAPEDVSAKYAEDLKKTTKETVSTLTQLIQQLGESLLPGNKTLNKTELKTLHGQIQSALMSLTDSIPFIEQQFGEEMETQRDKMIGELEAVANHLIHKTGLNALAQANEGRMLPTFPAPQLTTGKLCEKCDTPLVGGKCPEEGRHIL
jgi:hypothetical protein